MQSTRKSIRNTSCTRFLACAAISLLLVAALSVTSVRLAAGGSFRSWSDSNAVSIEYGSLDDSVLLINRQRVISGEEQSQLAVSVSDRHDGPESTTDGPGVDSILPPDTTTSNIASSQSASIGDRGDSGNEVGSINGSRDGQIVMNAFGSEGDDDIPRSTSDVHASDGLVNATAVVYGTVNVADDGGDRKESGLAKGGERREGEESSHWRVNEEEARRVSSSPPSSWRTAVCLVGGARDFELSAPSIMRRLLPSLSPRVTLFLHSPLDENSRKLWALKWAPALASQLTGSSGNGSSSSDSSSESSSAAVQVDIGAVRIFGNEWVNQSLFPRGVVVDRSSPKGEQGIFQYMRLVEGCVSLIREYESSHAMRFDWIVRTRVDTYWAEPPPPLSSLDPLAYAVPYGTDCSGYNDRFGAGTWATAHIALSRLSMLPAIGESGFRGLNSEKSFRAQLEVGGVRVKRADVPFCVVSRRVYRGNSVTVTAISSAAHLNGAKCRPCKARWRGKEALKQMTRYLPEGLPGPKLEGVDLCNNKKGWDERWENIFDSAVGSTLAAERKSIMEASREECERNFEELKRLSQQWLSPPPSALCVRALLGPAVEVGDKLSSFETFIKGIGQTSLVFSSDLNRKSKRVWEKRLTGMRPGLQLTPFDPTNKTHLSTRMDILKLSASGSDVHLVDGWIKAQKVPPACQLLVGFPATAKGKNKQREVVTGLSQLHFYMNSCILEDRAVHERCTFFSTIHCSEEYLKWPVI